MVLDKLKNNNKLNLPFSSLLSLGMNTWHLLKNTQLVVHAVALFEAELTKNKT